MAKLFEKTIFGYKWNNKADIAQFLANCQAKSKMKIGYFVCMDNNTVCVATLKRKSVNYYNYKIVETNEKNFKLEPQIA